MFIIEQWFLFVGWIILESSASVSKFAMPRSRVPIIKPDFLNMLTAYKKHLRLTIFDVLEI